MTRFRHRDATRKLVHATGFLQDAIVHLAGRAEDHALGLCETHTIRRAPGEICSDGRVASGGILQGKLVSGNLPRGQCSVDLKARRRRLFSSDGRI